MRPLTGKGSCAMTGMVCLALIAALLLLAGCGLSASVKRVRTVGREIASADITQFYYTESSSTNPPHYQRYRFYLEDGVCRFFHETRQGDHWPLTEADATVTGDVELTDAQWAQLLDCLQDGTVTARQTQIDSGSKGPWLYLYWNGDRDRDQQFAFASQEAEADFLALCREIAAP